MSLRDRRCLADGDSLRRRLREDGPIRLVSVEGDPPSRFVLQYDVAGVVVQDGEVQPKAQHLVDIYLPASYPRTAPQCRMLTPVFHPNIAPHAICIGDHWSAGESLPHLVVRIAEMLCFQSYNTKSPLNGDAAKWVEENAHRLPLDRYDFHVLLADDDSARRDGDGRAETVAAAADEPPPAVAPVCAGPEFAVRMLGAAPSAEPAEAAPPPREVECPRCHARLYLPVGWSSRWARCPVCGSAALVH